MELPQDPTILLLHIYPDETKSLIQKDECNSTIHSSTIYKSQDMEATEEWIKKMCVYIVYTHTHSWVLLSHKKNEILPSAATQMDPEIIILCEVSRTKTNII